MAEEEDTQGNHVGDKRGGGGVSLGKEFIGLCTLRPKSEGKGL